MSADERGFTLIETLIGAGLLMLLLALIVQIVIPMGKGTVRGSQQVELQQMAYLAVDQLRRDLEASPSSGLTTAGGLTAHRLVDVAADGSQVFASDLVVVWRDMTERRLWRRTWPPDPPTLARALTTDRAFRPTPDEFANLTSGRKPSDKVLAAQVEEFAVEQAGNTARIHLLLQAPAPDGKSPERFELNRTVQLPNTEI